MDSWIKSKSFLTLEQAADYLSSWRGNTVTVADVLQLGYDRHLTLSIHLLDRTLVCLGKIVRYTAQEIQGFLDTNNFVEGLDWADEPIAMSKAQKAGRPVPGWPLKALWSTYAGQTRWLTLEKSVSVTSGVWDLMMAGGESVAILAELMQLVGGPKIQSAHRDPIYIERDGTTCAVLLQCTNFLGTPSYPYTLADFKAATLFPDASMLCVRPEALDAFCSSQSESTSSYQDNVHPTRMETAILLLASCLNKLGIDWKARGAAVRLEELTELLGAKVDQDTIKRHFINGMTAVVLKRSRQEK